MKPFSSQMCIGGKVNTADESKTTTATPRQLYIGNFSVAVEE